MPVFMTKERFLGILRAEMDHQTALYGMILKTTFYDAVAARITLAEQEGKDTDGLSPV